MKYKRQRCILSIIREKEIKNQQELLEELEKRGFSVAQSTLSRDIKELELIKQPVNDEYVYSEKHNSDRFAAGGILSIEQALHTIVVKTSPGGAPVTAAAIDSMGDRRILGTVAGDDTVLVICSSPESAYECLNKILIHQLNLKPHT